MFGSRCWRCWAFYQRLQLEGCSSKVSIAGEEEGYYSPRSDSTFASFSERSQNIDELAGRLQAEGLDKSKSQDGSAQVA